ncbi:outer membrane beta-barrel protein [Hymenobacter arizonensis]|uniref:Outer membrane protein beta-barrel domain-containing protein n=1 Tax=Hymenobacter arizonensis TaxID=1227077 RepID=A0A1I6BNH7_HYMAR|nr:outer membrane beta-barrel protein [Hymenobacter arizonensis]SFQ82498.1 Outer membrane protein beta-barrel domain-containing protein [Hymenobacter arizonensis]
MYRSFLFFVFLIRFALTGSAQTAPAASAPRFYLGIGASALSYSPASSYNGFRRPGPALVAGTQLTPRWALQAGAALNWRREGASHSYRPSPSQDPTVYEYRVRSTTLTVPLLARHTFTDPAGTNPIGPFRADLLGGVTLLHTATHFTSSSTAAGQAPFLADERYTVTRGSVSLGLGARYALLPRLEVTADGLANVAVTNSFYGTSDRFFLNLGGGVRYYLGQGGTGKI